MGKIRWIVSLGALLVAGVAFYVLLSGGGNREKRLEPALDDIDAESRAAMRRVLRDADRRE